MRPLIAQVLEGRTAWLPLAAAAVLLAGCSSAPPQPDPMQVKVDAIDQRLSSVEKVINNQSLLQLSQRIDSLDEQLRLLRGEVEQLQNGTATLNKEQRDFYAALDQRVAALEVAVKGSGTAMNGAAGGAAAGAGPAGPTGAGPAGAGPAVGAAAAGGSGNGGAAAAGNDQAAYERAFNTLKSGDYSGAITQFHDFLQRYPQSSLDDNAQYWIGEAYYVMRDYDRAATAFRTVGAQYPQSRKAPDALLKLGMTLYDQQHVADARATLNQVIERFPDSDAAKIATTQLAKIGSESH
jgi:tol-pal system protein YbgF